MEHPLTKISDWLKFSAKELEIFIQNFLELWSFIVGMMIASLIFLTEDQYIVKSLFDG